MKNKNLLGKKIGELRNKKDLSQGQLAKEAELARTLITMIESGQRQPTDEALDKILKVLGTTKDNFYNSISSDAKEELAQKLDNSSPEAIVKMYRKVSHDG